VTPLEFVEIVGQIYAIQNPIGKLGIVGEMAMDRPQEFRKAIRSMAITVIVLSTMFSLVGGPLLSALNIDMVGFKIAGGIIILSTSVTTLIHGSTTTLGGKLEEAAVVPLATPLIVGPGTMTTLILYSTIYGPTATLIASLASKPFITSNSLRNSVSPCSSPVGEYMLSASINSFNLASSVNMVNPSSSDRVRAPRCA